MSTRHLAFVLAGLLAWCLFAAAPSRAQTTNLPLSVQQALLKVDMSWRNDVGRASNATADLFVPILKQDHASALTVTRNIAYGPSTQQVLDVYQPSVHAATPVVIFVHGGAYVGGDKDINDEMYANVPIWFARHGVLGINADYRLAPQAKWPAATDDLGSVVAWAHEHVAQYGGDPNRIYLVGHSAGATHVADYVMNPALEPKSGSGVAGAVLVSGRYVLDYDSTDPNAANMRAYFGNDPALYAQRSAIKHIGETKVPLFIVISEFENPTLDIGGGELYSEECEKLTACPRFARLAQHNHISEIASFNTSDELLGRDVLDFIHHGN